MYIDKEHQGADGEIALRIKVHPPWVEEVLLLPHGSDGSPSVAGVVEWLDDSCPAFPLPTSTWWPHESSTRNLLKLHSPPLKTTRTTMTIFLHLQHYLLPRIPGEMAGEQQRPPPRRPADVRPADHLDIACLTCEAAPPYLLRDWEEIRLERGSIRHSWSI